MILYIYAIIFEKSEQQALENRISAFHILAEEFFYKINDKDSSLTQLIDEYIFLFILKTLPLKDRRTFINTLEHNPEDAIRFAIDNIDNFNKRLTGYLTKKTQHLLEL